MKSRENINQWISDTIIALNLCPFAKAPFEKGLIRVEVSNAKKFDDQFSFFLDELSEIQGLSKTDISNSIIAYTDFKGDFLDFNDFVGSCEAILEELKLETIFQLVCFHPNFCFENTDPLDRINLVNRSPYPIIHILRFEEVELALQNIEEAKMINTRNEETLNELSLERCKELFKL